MPNTDTSHASHHGQGSEAAAGQEPQEPPHQQGTDTTHWKPTAAASEKPDAQPDEPNWIHGDLDTEDDSIDDNVADTSSVALKRRIKRNNPRRLTPRERIKRNRTVLAAVCAGVLVSIVKFIASAITGSMAMFSEGIHSLVDAINDSLMLVGARGSKRKPDIKHPFGYGRVLYFYTFIVSVVILFFGGGFTVIQGISSLQSGAAAAIENPALDYCVLAIGIVIEGFSLRIAWQDVSSARGEDTLIHYIRNSKSPTSFTVLLEDTAAVLGMVFAFAGIALTQLTGNPMFDSAASILIGVLMGLFATVLVRETSSLLIGEGLSPDEIADIVFIVEEDPAVIKCGRVLSMYMGPNDMVLNLDVTFDDELDEGDILQAIDRVEAELVDDYPQCSAIFIEVESLNQVYRQRLDRRQDFLALEAVGA